MGTEIVLQKPPGSLTLPDNAQWDHRFQIRSETSDRLYIIARNTKSGKWGCSCPAYRTKRACKHLLDGCGLRHDQIHGRDHLDGHPRNTPPQVRETRALDATKKRRS